MITVKLGELKNIVNGLNQIMGEKLPVKTAYAFTKLAKIVQKEVQDYEDNRKKLIDAYCAKDEKGKPIIENGIYAIEDKESFGKEFNELSNIEVEIDFKPVSIDDFGNVQVSPMAMMALEKFIGD